ncbi:cytochrome c [Pseudomonas sp. LJDD11]|uniref:c-type cytochrome n=1 Tax=unclassified Pseudomonas TaxID=196821 RepID=UPI0004F72733|nr:MULTISPECIES: cytochrome c [unclassified Pseudomonas]MCQ9424865.1 cytochrome c [Pseudomonas sp. LJDD11]BAP44118.1 gluconate 2-dehydrogenase [Pseudomonas sp. StFLB209]
MNRTTRYLLVVGVAVAAGLAWFVTRTPHSPLDNQTPAAATPELIQRGEYVARLGDCVACHSTPKGAPFAGGYEMATPMGSIFTTNITPDPQTGIGRYSLADFDRAVRSGVAADGHRLYPAMPYPSYAKYSDEDIRALYAFFMHGVKPVQQANQPGKIAWPLNIRWPIALWNAMFAPQGAYQDKAGQDALWNRGAYIVQGPGHCGSCHTPRGLAMNEQGMDESSPRYLSGALLDGWYAPSLRQDPNTGLGRWSEGEIVQYLQNGRNVHSVVTGTMTEAFNNSTQYMTDHDLAGIARYLASLPGDPQRDGPAWDPARAQALTASDMQKPGAANYVAKCSSCHGIDGRGQGQWMPPLAGASSSMAKHSATSINVALNGSDRVVAQGMPDAYRMPPYRNQLNDQEMADVLTFIRSSWGNQGGPVTPAEVAELRERTRAASSNPIILQMR